MAKILIVGVYATDLVFSAERLPNMGETVISNDFSMGPGGKGSNQAIAAAKVSSNTEVSFYTRLGQDDFAQMALDAWQQAGVRSIATQHSDQSTGVAYIFCQNQIGDNAIMISPGAAGKMSAKDIYALEAEIASSDILITQLEQPLEVVQTVLSLARKHKVTTILNPAPVQPLPASLLALCDYITPNEGEALQLIGSDGSDFNGDTLEQAKACAQHLLSQGVGQVIVTLGEKGAILVNRQHSLHVPAVQAGACIDTTGAGDSFTASFAVALSEGKDEESALNFASAVAGICVTRRGAGNSMPTRHEVEQFMSLAST